MVSKLFFGPTKENFFLFADFLREKENGSIHIRLYTSHAFPSIYTVLKMGRIGYRFMYCKSVSLVDQFVRLYTSQAFPSSYRVLKMGRIGYCFENFLNSHQIFERDS